MGFLDCALHVQLSFPSTEVGGETLLDTIVSPLQDHFNNCLKFENKASLVLDRFVSKFLPPQEMFIFSGEKFTVVDKIDTQQEESMREMRAQKKLSKAIDLLGGEAEEEEEGGAMFSSLFG